MRLSEHFIYWMGRCDGIRASLNGESYQDFKVSERENYSTGFLDGMNWVRNKKQEVV